MADRAESIRPGNVAEVPDVRGPSAHSPKSESIKALRRPWFICLLLAVAVAAVYWRVLDCGFVNYDDPDYVSANSQVRGGFNAAGVAWAFSTGWAGNWHPVTWLSHMFDAQVFGMRPSGHHLTNLLLHLANSALLFLLLNRMTRRLWPSATVAALFALHPLHVESVAWVAERKDVLSTLFWILAVWAYAGYASRDAAAQKSSAEHSAPARLSASGPCPANPAPAAPRDSKIIFYALALVFFALGLMSKPMVLTLPFILLLLDYWPLRRAAIPDFAGRAARAAAGDFPSGERPRQKSQLTPLRQLLVETAPFFALSMGSCVVTFLVQQSGGAVSTSWPFSARLANAVIAYARYLGKTFWPARLSYFYPHPDHWPALAVMGACALLALITAAVIWRARRQPYLAVGWFWFIAMLAPTIGLVQVGLQSMADRYTYLPLAGIFIMLVWGLDELLAGGGFGNRVLAAGGVVSLVVCACLTVRQVGYWRDSDTLFQHAVEVDHNNFLAYYNLGCTRFAMGRREEAFADFRRTVELAPDFARGQNNWGKALFQQGRLDDALVHLKKAVRLQPRLPDAHYNLGAVLLAQGHAGEALDQFQIQVDLAPDDAVAQANLANVLVDSGLKADAIPYYEKALKIQPDFAEAHYKLANILDQQGEAAQAIVHYRQALQSQPANLKARNNLAWILATSPQASTRNGREAVRLAAEAEKLSGGTNAIVLGTLAAAYAEAAKFPDAIATAQKARELAVAQGNAALADALGRQMSRYRIGAPLRDSR